MKAATVSLLLAIAGASFLLWNFRKVAGVPYSKEFLAASIKYGVPVKRSVAIGKTESNFSMVPDGSAGEKGIMQLKPIAVSAAERWSGDNFAGWQTDPKANIKAGVAYLGQLRAEEFTNIDDATRAYNKGPTDARRGEGFQYLALVKNNQTLFS